MNSREFFDKVVMLTSCTHRLWGIDEISQTRFIHDPGGETSIYLPFRTQFASEEDLQRVVDWVKHVHGYQSRGMLKASKEGTWPTT